MFIQEVKDTLFNNIIPFWKNLKDKEYGGFYGYLDFDLKLHKKATKGVILNSRILWFFANAYTTVNDEECIEYAKHAYKFLKDYCLDKEYGGVHWSLQYDGNAADTTKHTYNQAFAIYALSSYYGATGDAEALQLAYELFDLIETRCKDSIGYLEAFNQAFEPVDNDKLSENGLMASKTMNTLLHVFEAYTELYRVDKQERVGNQLRWIMNQFAEVLYNPKRQMLEVFFDENMRTLSDLNSYGHDIEASWLIDRGCEVLGDNAYTKKMFQVTEALRRHILEEGFDGNSLNNECFHGEVDTTKIWWVEAEAILGFINGYQLNTERKEYQKAAKKIWDFTKNYIIDKRLGSEWFYDVNKEGEPVSRKEIAGPWKCPYHNGRMCFEVIKRNVDW
ncbi:cellobiose 2-epimerase [Anaerocolumna cellulosilytica]|uniref:Cellobiose 2-epimerase n=1 Tax=Anaerocolumna cellulosilytica TaxID=433286 RepID=A0A6S6R3T4_9FIRM|nr:AGE family epimerase/isomerase [Anaerocolumna cellulosilytica]MBB5195303.1 mannobiose 2-epimerase [Anaerocolumna cellulosilytica]BCJ96776.1 cellobiose 2-epimerase [Anaerocolumna cellulosilytica]